MLMIGQCLGSLQGQKRLTSLTSSNECDDRSDNVLPTNLLVIKEVERELINGDIRDERPPDIGKSKNNQSLDVGPNRLRCVSAQLIRRMVEGHLRVAF